MARGLRIHVPEGWYHVTSRGNGGQAIYRDDVDRRRFLGFLAELPRRFGAEVHAFVLMPSHYQLLLRCRQADISETLRWLQTAYAIGFNGAHARRGRLFQGRFKSVLIQDDAALDRVARHVHLDPVQVDGLELGREAQRRAKIAGCKDPDGELVKRRVEVLRGFPWSSWRAYSGLEPTPAWLTTERVLAGCGGRGRKAQTAALVRYTEAPIRQGRAESPWEGLVAGSVLGDAEEARALIRAAAARPGRQAQRIRESRLRNRPAWSVIVSAAEEILGRGWKEMTERYGDWGRDGTLAVASRELGWSLAEAARAAGGIEYVTAAQGVRRFWIRAESKPEMGAFARKLSEAVLKTRSSIVHV